MHIDSSGRAAGTSEKAEAIATTKGSSGLNAQVHHNDLSGRISNTTSTPPAPTTTGDSTPSKRDIRPLFTSIPLSRTQSAATTPHAKEHNTESQSDLGTGRTRNPSITAHPVQPSNQIPSFPYYQDLTPLVDAFKNRLRNFLDAFEGSTLGKGFAETGNEGSSTMVTNDTVVGSDKINVPTPQSVGTGTNPEAEPAVFSFEGEYSVISARGNRGGKSEAQDTWRRLRRVVQEIERVCGLNFRYVLSAIHTHLVSFPLLGFFGEDTYL